MASSSLQQMAPSLIGRSKTLKNKDLQDICRAERQPTSGVKAQLQTRVVALINRAVAHSDHALFNRLQLHISGNHTTTTNNNNGLSAAMHGSYPTRTPSESSPNLPNGRSNMTNGYSQLHGSYHQTPPPARAWPVSADRANPRANMATTPRYFFKESPFFEIRELLLDDITLEASPSHRQSITKNLALTDNVCARLRSDPTLRILLFCAVEQPLAVYTRLDITFPSQIEVRVNNEEVKANYKGLKNKPGSTRPADITDLMRVTPANYRNTIHITYALTQKKFNLFVYMARKFSVDELAKRIKQRNVITKHSVLNEMREKANDPDIVVESSVMSLKDPISTLRISTPCRSTVCTHNQCFDGESFLQLQEQAPTWTCPICNKIISFEALAVDEYVQEILDKVSRGTDQVTIEPDGQWVNEKEATASNSNGNRHGHSYNDHDDSEEDLVEIPDYRVTSIKTEARPTPQFLAATPPIPSREASSTPRTGSKRTSEVVDLTLSDDDEPVRPSKKVAYSTPHRGPEQLRHYHLPSQSFGTPSVHRPSNLRVNDSSSTAQSGRSFGRYQAQPRTGYPGQETMSYPTYIDSSP